MAKKRRPPPPDEPTPDPSDDRVKFPFGETTSDGSWELDSDQDADLGDSVLESEDLGSSDLDASGFEDEMSEIVDSGSGGARLPNVPPGARASDDLSFESLLDTSGEDSSEDASRVDLDADPGPPISDLGPISPSGPLVIVDDEGEDSSRYQASLVDDSIRVAGAASARVPRKKGPKRSKQRSWREEQVDPDADVPTLSGRRGRTPAAPPAKPSRAPLAVVALLGLLATGGVAYLLDRQRQADLAALEARLKQEYEQQLAALRKERDQLAEAGQASKAALASEKRARADERAQARKAAADRLAAAEREAAREREAAVAEERRKAKLAARQAAEVELARARSDAEAKRRAAIREAVAAEKRRGEAALKEQGKAAEAQKLEELAELRKKLEGELAAATTRKEEEALAKALEEEKKSALDAVEEQPGGSVSDDVEDWDKYFQDDGGEGGKAKGEEVAGEEAPPMNPVDAVWAWAKENIHGSVGYVNKTHFSTGPDGGPHDLRKTRHELRVALEYRDWLLRSESGSVGLRAVVELDARIDDDDYAAGVLDTLDDEDPQRPILTTKDAYLALAIDWFEIRAGYQIYSWGTGDLLNPTDNLNPIDFSDLFDTRRIPVLSYAVTLDFDALSFELISIPTFTRSRLPLRDKRFDLLRNSPLPIVRPDDPDFSLQHMQWAARAVGHVGGFDLSLSGYTGFNDLPTATLAVLAGPPPTTVILPVFDRMHVLGADFATTLGIFGAEGTLGQVLKGIQLHGEAAHFWFEGGRLDDYLQMVIGLNYQFVDVIREHDISIALEFASDVQTRAGRSSIPQVGLNRIFRESILARIQYAVDENLSFEVAGALVLHGPENAYLHPAAKWNVTDNLRLELAGDVFLGPTDTFFGQFRRDGRVQFTAQIVF